jgi:carbon-monoxide dehydrogenase small subunit
MSDTVNVAFTVNGTQMRVVVEPRRSLADTLRDQCNLTGTHLGCEHGVCGACTVIVNGAPVRSCLMFGVQADGADIRTVEGLANGDTLHPLQAAFWTHHGLQCGFCTPGFLMLAVWLLEQPGPVDGAQLRHVLSSNLCRCTGYTNIMRAVTAAAKEMGKWADSAEA